VALADNMGAVLGLTNPLMAGVRDWLFQAVNSVGQPALAPLGIQVQTPRPPSPKAWSITSVPSCAKTIWFGQLFVQALTSKMPRANVGASTTCWATRMPCWVTVTNPRAPLSEDMGRVLGALEQRALSRSTVRAAAWGATSPLTAMDAISVEGRG
jgi:3-(3-hydroxy-phenyl)propionate hydroxylase